MHMKMAIAQIEKITAKGKNPWTNGFVERFNRTVKEEFLPIFFGK